MPHWLRVADHTSRGARRVCCALDLSPESQALAAVAARCVLVPGGSLELLHVWDPGPPTGMDLLEVTESDVAVEYAAASEQLARLVRRLQPVAFHVATEVLRGSPASTILNHARQHGCDLLVVGTRGLKGVKRIVLGSVAEQIVRHAGCPVLVVPRRVLDLAAGVSPTPAADTRDMRAPV